MSDANPNATQPARAALEFQLERARLALERADRNIADRGPVHPMWLPRHLVAERGRCELKVQGLVLQLERLDQRSEAASQPEAEEAPSVQAAEVARPVDRRQLPRKARLEDDPDWAARADAIIDYQAEHGGTRPAADRATSATAKRVSTRTLKRWVLRRLAQRKKDAAA